MKVIQVGKIPEPIRHTCRHCETIFEFSILEIEKHHTDMGNTYGFVNCPICTAWNYIAEKEFGNGF